MESESTSQQEVAAENQHQEPVNAEPAGVTQSRSPEEQEQNENGQGSAGKKEKLMGCQAMNESVQEEIKGDDDALNQGVRYSLNKVASPSKADNADQPFEVASAEYQKELEAPEEDPKHRLLSE